MIIGKIENGLNMKHNMTYMNANIFQNTVRNGNILRNSSSSKESRD